MNRRKGNKSTRCAMPRGRPQVVSVVWPPVVALGAFLAQNASAEISAMTLLRELMLVDLERRLQLSAVDTRSCRSGRFRARRAIGCRAEPSTARVVPQVDWQRKYATWV
jgi:hypothetical protein